MTIQQAVELGARHFQAGQSRQAEEIFRQILSAVPNHPDALHFLGLIAYQSGQAQAAIEMMRRAIAINPNVPAYHVNLGRMLGESGHPNEALAAYAQAIRLEPDNFAAHHNLGTAFLAQGKLQEAIDAFRSALRIQPDALETMNKLGQALHKVGQQDEAIALFRRAIQLDPNYAAAHTNLGIALKFAGDIPAAVNEFSQVVRLEPNNSEAWMNFGKMMQAAGDQDAAIESFRRAIAIAPQKYDGYYNVGNALQEKGRNDEAIAAFQQAIGYDPQNADVYNNLALSYHATARFDEEIDTYHKALSLKSDLPIARYNLGLTQLLMGDYENGWKGYEFRTQTRELGTTWQEFSQPRWEGTPLASQRILIHAEQAFGDTIQFARFLPLVAERGGRVILQCQAELLTLFKNLEGVEHIIPFGQTLPDFELHCPLLSLPLVFQTRVDTIPRRIPYITADEQAVTIWRQRLHSIKELKVGLVWTGRTKPNPHRSIPLELLSPLASVRNVHFFSLQIGAVPNPKIFPMTDWSSELIDFSQTAALMENLDLIISVDTAAAHLAGAMGKPVWLLAMFVPDWRWLLNRDDSPWYPTMKILRQHRAGDWSRPVEAIVQDLQHLSTTEVSHREHSG